MVPRVGVESEQQLLAYATATATPDPSLICDLYRSSQQCWILNPVSGARDWTVSSWILVGFHNPLNHRGNTYPFFFFFFFFLLVCLLFPSPTTSPRISSATPKNEKEIGVYSISRPKLDFLWGTGTKVRLNLAPAALSESGCTPSHPRPRRKTIIDFLTLWTN